MGTQVDPTYHRSLLPITRRVVEPLLDAAAVGPGMRMLDVGSGPGYVGAAAAARDATAVGVDVAPAMVALARTLHPQVEFVQGDAEHLQFADDSFGAVVGNFAVLHLGRPELAAAEFARVLSAGGKVALSVWDVPAASRMPGVFTTPSRRSGRRRRRMCRPGRRSTASPTRPSSPGCSATPGSST